MLGFRLFRRLWLEQLMSLMSARISETTFLQIRTCWLDDVVTRFVRDLQGRPGQLVILGSGYDSRCHRLDLPGSVARFEVDAAGTQGRKRALLDEIQGGREGTLLVTCDFSRESWMEKLVALPAGEERVWIEGQGLAVLDELRYEELLARYMPDDARGRTLGARGDFGCFLVAGVPSRASPGSTRIGVGPDDLACRGLRLPRPGPRRGP